MISDPDKRYAGCRVLVVGLGVSGASAVRYLLREGAEVVVTDSRAAPAGVESLRAQFPHVMLCLGSFHTPSPLSQFAMAVVSPGVALDEPFVRELAATGVDVVGDIELFARAVSPITNHQSPITKVIGITGSNGKSTVTTLVGEMARAAGLRVAVGGNLGTPVLDLLADGIECYVLELSSFQLETTHSLRCAAATVLNLSQDHLDRHGTMAHYAAVKARIFQRCDTAVVNRDDPAVMREAQGLKPETRVVSFGLGEPDKDQYGLREIGNEAWLFHGQSPITNHQSLRIFGLHNAANALAALALADAVGIARAASLQALRDFPGLPHRCEFVATRGGVQYFNDSKGTNVGSTLAALLGLPPGIVWLGGGQGKNQSFVELRPALAQKGRAAVLFGEDAALIERDVFGALPIYREEDLTAALARARELAQPGDRVLLSPACASLDQFKSYVDRGNRFRAAVEALP